MTAPKILLYLHGVRSGNGNSQETQSRWKDPLFSKLREIGYEGLEKLRVIAPEYAHLFLDTEQKVSVPRFTIDQLKGQDEADNRRQYEQRLSALEIKMGHNFLGSGKFYQDKLVGGVTNFGPLRQAKMYIENKNIRGAVLDRILSELPAQGNIVIVGHSLGSVIAADLIRRLPVDLRVDGLVTVGSPLGSAYFGKNGIQKDLAQPPTNLEWWLNFWGTGDPVAASRGVSATIPWVLDLAINTGIDPAGAHSSARYVAHSEVAKSIGDALFGSVSKEVLLSETGVEVPLNDRERFAVAELRFIYLLEKALETSRDIKEKKAYLRFASVRKIIQSRTIAGLIEGRVKEGKPIPAELNRMSVDLSLGFDVKTPVPTQIVQIDEEVGVVMLPHLFAGNPLSPYEIPFGDGIRKSAAKTITAEMELTSGFGEQVLASIENVEKALQEKNRSKVWKVGAASLGVLAVVAATGGLALAAAPGVYGGAAVVSALAAFGPGGMIGGLFSSGALLSAGTGTLALSLSNAGNSAEVTEELLIIPLTEAELRKLRGLDENPRIWFEIVEAEIQIQRQYAHLAAFCDPKSSVLDDLGAKLRTIRNAIEFLRSLGLDPSDESPDPAQDELAAINRLEILQRVKK